MDMSLDDAEIHNMKEEASTATWLWAMASFMHKGEVFDTSGYAELSTIFVWNGLQDSLKAQANRQGDHNGR